jgi:hypothetical protein
MLKLLIFNKLIIFIVTNLLVVEKCKLFIYTLLCRNYMKITKETLVAV